MRHNVLILSVVVLSGVLSGHRCNLQDTTSAIRQVHIGVRQSFIMFDDEVSLHLERAGDRCIAQVVAEGLSGEDGMQSWRVCMEQWNRLAIAISTSRESLAMLEQIYDDIDAGNAREVDWRFWAVQVISHARTAMRIVNELGLIPSSLSGFRDSIEQLCNLISCQGD